MLPQGILISEVEVTHFTPNFKTESLNLVEKVKSRGLHRLEGSFKVMIGKDIESQKAWQAFLLKTKGTLSTFEVDLPMLFKSDLNSNPNVIGSYSVGATQLELASLSEKIYAGSCFTIPNDTKVYYILDTIEYGGIVEIYPALRNNILSNATLNFISPVITARFDEDKQIITFSENGFVLEANVSFKEAL